MKELAFEEENNINKTVAEFCGHKNIALQLVGEGTGMEQYILSSGIIGEGGYAIPYYTRDLNAMNVAEDCLMQHDWADVYWPLYEKTLVTDENYIGSLLCVPSRDKAEAFVKILNLMNQVDENDIEDEEA